MAAFRSNLYSEVLPSVHKLSRCLHMRAKGRYKRVGEDALDIIAEGIYDRTVLGQQEPNMAPLAPLAPSTLRKKRSKGQPETIGVATKKMLDMEQLKGERDIGSYSAEVEYGKGEEEKLKATWFTEGSRQRRRPQPARPFFEFDDDIEKALDRLVDEVVDRTIEQEGGA